jgi:biofilm PGA synthesis N-glycosyltransferase PgaC
MPETLSGLWSQRLRWSQGGIEVLMRYYKKAGIWLSRRMWGVYIEFFVSVFWAYTMLLTFSLWLAGYFIDLPQQLNVPTMLPSWGGVLLGLTCLLQFAVSLFIDSRYEKGIGTKYFWVIWYPLVFWVLTVLTTIVGVIKAIIKKKGTPAIWESPDRGVR